ncbi:Leucine-rich repeat protein kinase family protein [Prunus dulcis]|uniref:Leucine-rich repeat protein kinase family protein n=1 Tax=Prunus dulcis TaxID=3755 RepID=A0A5H2XUH9_PRUDU|nr:Leucine-rich repeat protein kinase family protein [Prunus dulcis]
MVFIPLGFSWQSFNRQCRTRVNIHRILCYT